MNSGEPRIEVVIDGGPWAEPIPGHFPNEEDDSCGGCHEVWPCRGWMLGQMYLAQGEATRLRVALEYIGRGHTHAAIYARHVLGGG